MSRLTPITNDVPAFCQKTTPVKARIQDTVDFLKSEGIKAKREAIFHYNWITYLVQPELGYPSRVIHVY